MTSINARWDAARVPTTHGPTVNQRIFRAFLRISSALLLVRVMGMFSQIAITSRFGAGAVMDAYFVASALPVLVASLITGALEASVIPTFAQVRARKSPQEVSLFFSSLLNTLLAATALLTLIMLILRRQMIFLIAPALDPSRMSLAITLAPLIFPTFLLLTGIGFLEDILNAEGQFGWPAYAGMLVPFSTAIFVLVAGGTWGVAILCIGTIVGLVLQLAMVLVRLWRSGITYRLTIDIRSPEIGLVLTAAWPALVGGLISRASPIIDQVFASFLTAGSISALNYSLKLLSIPTGLIFAAVGRAALPYLARQVADQDMGAFKSTLRFYLWVTGGVTVFVATLMFALSHLAVRILFQRGAFTAADATLTADTLRGFVVGLVPMALGFVAARSFSALRKTRVLMYTSLFSVVANAVFDTIFAYLWQSFGIALATSLVYFCTMAILLVTLQREVGSLALLTPPPELVTALHTSQTRLRAWVKPRWGHLREAMEPRVVAILCYLRESPSSLQRATIEFTDEFSVLWMRWKQEFATSSAFHTLDESMGHTTRQVPSRRVAAGLLPRSSSSSGPRLLHWVGRPLLYTAALLGVVGLGIASVFVGPSLAVRIAFGIPVILLFLRYPYVLLLAWVGIEVLFGSSLSFLSGNNLVTALTLPAIVVAARMPLKQAAQRMPPLVAWLLFTLWVLASIGISGQDVISFLKEWTLVLSYVVMGVLVINLLRTRRHVTGVIDVILGVAALIALYGVLGFVTHQHGQVDAATGVFRATSIFALATGLSFHLSMVLPLAIFRAYTLQGARRFLLFGVAGILLLGVLLTFTRTAYIAVALSVITQMLFLPSRRLRRMVIGGGLALGAILVILAITGYTNIFARFLNPDLTTLNGRLFLWRAVLNHFDPWQILGHGLGASDELLARLHIGEGGVTSSSLIGTSAHSLFLAILYDHGIIGVTLLALTFVILFYTLLKRVLLASGEHRALFATALAVCVATLSQSIDSNQLLIPALGIYLWAIVALPFANCWPHLVPSRAPSNDSQREPNQESGQEVLGSSQALPPLPQSRPATVPLVRARKGT